jgi:hypothetical protein
MTDENGRPVEDEAAIGSGGPAPMVLDVPDVAPPPWLGRCECREAVLLRMIAAGELPLPMSGSFRTLAGIVKAAAIQKLRALSHDLADANDWSRPSTTYPELERRRSTYDQPARTAAQIRAQARHSWAVVERQISEQHGATS